MTPRPVGVFYMAHPLTEDNSYTYLQNMDHVLKILGILLRNNIRAIAPYHAHCLVLDDKNPQERSLGLTIDCAVITVLDGIFLTGHKLSKGMEKELQIAETQNKTVVNLIGVPDRLIPRFLESM